MCEVEVFTRPARLGFPPTEEVTELSELTEEALGLFCRVDLHLELLPMVVEGKPMRVTLCAGANRPYLGRHWKYLKRQKKNHNRLLKF